MLEGLIGRPLTVTYMAKNYQTGLTNIRAYVMKPDLTVVGAFPLMEYIHPLFSGVYSFEYVTNMTDSEGKYLITIVSPTEGHRVNISANFKRILSSGSITSGDVEAIVNGVWSKAMASSPTPGTTMASLKTAASSSIPADIATAVWNALTSNFDVNGTFGGELVTKGFLEGKLQALENTLLGTDVSWIINTSFKFNSQTDEAVFASFLVRNGALVPDPELLILARVKDQAGSTIVADLIPFKVEEDGGIYKFLIPDASGLLIPGNVYQCEISIRHNGQPYTSSIPFIAFSQDATQTGSNSIAPEQQSVTEKNQGFPQVAGVSVEFIGTLDEI